MEWFSKKGKSLLKKYLKEGLPFWKKKTLSGFLLLQDDAAFQQFLKDVEAAAQTSKKPAMDIDAITAPDFAAIIAKAEKRRAHKRLRQRIVPYLVAAGIAVIVLVAVCWKFQLLPNGNYEDVPYMVVGSKQPIDSQAELPPASFQCIVSIGNANPRTVDSKMDGIVLQYGKLQIAQHNPGVLQIKRTDIRKGVDPEPEYVDVHTPALKQYIVELPDGTVIRLDGGSTIRYMLNHKDSLIHFCQLEGQAYVKVNASKENELFVLENTTVQIQTHKGAFVCLSEKGHSRTTMLEGEVKLLLESPRKVISLTEDANSVETFSFLVRGGNTKVRDSIGGSTCQNKETALYWTKKARLYDHVPLIDFMKDMERWYGFKIENTNCLPKAIIMHVLVNYPAKLEDVFAAVKKRGVSVYVYNGMLTFCPPAGKLDSKRWEYMVENKPYAQFPSISIVAYP